MAVHKWNNIGFPQTKFNQVAWANISKINSITETDAPPQVPSGLIIPYNTSNAVPSGWSLYSSADGYYLHGAGGAKAVDATYADSASSEATTTNGAHTGSASGYSAGNAGNGNLSEGDHSHTFNFGPYTPPYQEARLIKADSALDEFPQYGVVFGTGTLTGLTNIWTDGYMFKANTALGTGGSNTVSVTTNSAGSHDHGSSAGGASTGKDNRDLCSAEFGSHTHSAVSITVTNSLYLQALSAWHDASAAYELTSGMIAMYENTTPPSGWSLCDGTGGTPDLTDYYVKLVATGSEGASGDGTITMTATFSHGNHKHDSGDDSSALSETARHDTNVAMASHTVSSPNQSWEIRNYALAFIMKDA